MDLIKLFANVHCTGFDDIIWLGHSNASELDACLGLDLLDEHLCLGRVERDTGTTGSSTRRTTTPVNVGLSLFGWLDLNDQVDVGDVNTARGYVSGDEHTELAFLEALQSDFALVLGDVTMHDFDVRLDFVA